ncbi:MAG: hypothetical protein U5L11_16420 [Arhodomonas sp.]|nr:hypothetical protein [Arhodomonas sp.]
MRLSTLERIAHTAGLEIRLVPRDCHHANDDDRKHDTDLDPIPSG